MSKLFLPAALLLTLLPAWGQDAQPKPASEPAPAGEEAPAEAKPYGLDTCLISDKALGDEPVIKDFEGQQYAFCCKGCIKKFDKDPAAMVAKYNEAMAAKEAAAKEAEGETAAPPMN